MSGASRTRTGDLLGAMRATSIKVSARIRLYEGESLRGFSQVALLHLDKPRSPIPGAHRWRVRKRVEATTERAAVLHSMQSGMTAFVQSGTDTGHLDPAASFSLNAKAEAKRRSVTGDSGGRLPCAQPDREPCVAASVRLAFPKA
jgi:hypothetical protein